MSKIGLYTIGSIFLVLFVLFSIGCSNNLPTTSQDNSKLNYDFHINDFKDISKVLSQQKYFYSPDKDKKYIAIIIYNNNNASVKQYLINKNETLDLNISKDSTISMSLPEDTTGDYRWDVKSTTNNGVLKFDYIIPISLPIPNSERKLAYKRKNFFFKTEGIGNEKIVMRYAQLPDKQPPNDDKRNELINITFNLNVE